jgi:Ca2+-binding RTX toxin-like protein
MAVRKWGVETEVNTNTQGSQFVSAVTALLDGGFALTWETEDSSIDGSGFATMMRIFNADGTPRTGEILVNTQTSANQLNAAMVQTPDGNIWVAFEDDFSGGNASGISFRRFDANGNAIDLADQVAVDIAGGQIEPAISVLGNGVVIGYRNINDLQARRFDPAGNQVGGTSVIISTANTELDVNIAPLADGGFAAVWRDTGSDHIRLRLFDGSGLPTTSAVDVSDTAGAHFSPTVTSLANGNFLVAWQDNSLTPPDTSSSAIRAQLFDVAGNALGPEFLVNSLFEGGQGHPAVQPLDDGGFAIFHHGDALRGQIFDAFGGRIGAEFQVNTTTTSTQYAPFAAVLADGRIVVSWGDNSNTGTDTSELGVRFQIVDPRDGIITGSDGAETLLGHDLLNDEINGLHGNDTLNGGGGSDATFGGQGSDLHIVESAGDRPIELLNHGTDTVRSSISFTLGANLENLVLTGPSVINGTGNGLGNAITGNSKANLLRGEAGDDVLSGGGSKDVLDGGSGLDNLNGGSGKDTLTGGSDSDSLNGGSSSDHLTGGTGADFFVFSTAPASGNVDRITDFRRVDDTIRLDDAIFTALGVGPLAGSAFRANATGNAADSSDRIIYEKDTGKLFYDADGNGAGARVQFALLANKATIKASDFEIV